MAQSEASLTLDKNRKEKATPKCILCEFYPKTSIDYILHLRLQHQSSLKDNGLYLICSCSSQLHYYKEHKTTKKCHIGHFSLHKIDNGEDEPSMIQTKSANETHSKTGDNKRKSPMSDVSISNSETKKSRVSKEIDSELNCIECEYHTSSVSAWLMHLRNKHSTTPSLTGVALLCECGHECLSDAHSLSCDTAKYTVIRKRDGPIRRFEDDKTTPKCILCEIYPKTAVGYIQHLRIHHKSTLKANGIYLLCSCGWEVLNDIGDPNHTMKCDGRDFALHKLHDS